MTSSSNIDSHFSPGGGSNAAGSVGNASGQPPQYPYQQQQQNHLPSHNQQQQQQQQAFHHRHPVVFTGNAMVTPIINGKLSTPMPVMAPVNGPVAGRTISRQKPTVGRDGDAKGTTLPSKVSQIYYRHGLFLSSYPACAISFSVAVIICCW